MGRLGTVKSHLHVLRVGEIDVRPAIAVIVDQRDTPLMDSTMYFCSELERCSNRMPVDSVISTSSGYVSVRSNGAFLPDLGCLSATALGAAAGCVFAMTAALSHYTN